MQQKPTSDSIHADVDDFLSHCIMTSGIVVCGIFLSGNQLLGMKESLVSPCSDFVNYCGFQVDEQGSRDMLSHLGFSKEGVERGIRGVGFIDNFSIGSYAVLETVELPASISDLDSGLSYVDRDHFSLKCNFNSNTTFTRN